MRSFSIFFSVLLVVCCAGCHRSGKNAGDEAKPTDPDEVLHDQLSKGSFALSATASDLEDACNAAQALQAKVPAEGDMREDVDDLAGLLDTCGESIGDFTTEPPALGEFKKHLPEEKQQLQSALKAATEALNGLYEAADAVANFQAGAPKALKQPLEDLADSIDSAIDDVTTAITDMGGTAPPQPEDDSEDSTDNKQP